jgi:hypothetical protein
LWFEEGKLGTDCTTETISRERQSAPFSLTMIKRYFLKKQRKKIKLCYSASTSAPLEKPSLCINLVSPLTNSKANVLMTGTGTISLPKTVHTQKNEKETEKLLNLFRRILFLLCRVQAQRYKRRFAHSVQLFQHEQLVQHVH